MQWIHLSDGRWMSEKNPGYPLFVAPFQMLGILRAAPQFAGAVASISLFAAGRRWLGNWGGTWAVVLFVSSGAAISFAWRLTMPSFTDAALVAAGAGALLWTFLADDASPRRRTIFGFLGFVSLEGAVFIRYTDIVMLLVAVVVALHTFKRARIPARSLSWWLGSVVLFAGGVMVFDQAFYGGALKTGYGAGEITFALRAIIPNLRIMPPNLAKAIPALRVGIGSLGLDGRQNDPEPVFCDRTGFLATKIRTRRGHWPRARCRVARPLAPLFGLHMDRRDRIGRWSVGRWRRRWRIDSIRFDLPAIGLISLLGAWLLLQLPKWLPTAVLVVVAVAGFASFRNLTAAGAVGPNGSGGFPGGLPGQSRGTRLPAPGSGVKLPNGFDSAPAASPPGLKPSNGKPPAGLTPPRGIPKPQ